MNSNEEHDFNPYWALNSVYFLLTTLNSLGVLARVPLTEMFSSQQCLVFEGRAHPDPDRRAGQVMYGFSTAPQIELSTRRPAN